MLITLNYIPGKKSIHKDTLAMGTCVDVVYTARIRSLYACTIYISFFLIYF
jgi:hypothetical protein